MSEVKITAVQDGAGVQFRLDGGLASGQFFFFAGEPRYAEEIVRRVNGYAAAAPPAGIASEAVPLAMIPVLDRLAGALESSRKDHVEDMRQIMRGFARPEVPAPSNASTKRKAGD